MKVSSQILLCLVLALSSGYYSIVLAKLTDSDTYHIACFSFFVIGSFGEINHMASYFN